MVQNIKRSVLDLTPAGLNNAIIPVDKGALTDLDNGKILVPVITKNGVGITADTMIAYNFIGANGASTGNSDDPNRYPTNFVDDSQISTAQFKTGTSSGFIDGVDANAPSILITPPPDQRPLFSGTAVTVECWLRPDDISDDGVGLAWLDIGGGDIDIVADMSSGGFIIYVNKGGGGSENKWTIPHAWVVDTWVHYRMSMIGTTVTFAITGLGKTVTVVDDTNPAAISATLALVDVLLGHASDTPTTNNYQGYMDGFKITDAALDAVTTFTPQTTIFERETLSMELLPIARTYKESGDTLTIDKKGTGGTVIHTFDEATSPPVWSVKSPVGQRIDHGLTGYSSDVSPQNHGGAPNYIVQNADNTDNNYSRIEGRNSGDNVISMINFINDSHGSNDGSMRAFNAEGGSFNEYHKATKEGYNLYPNQPAFSARVNSTVVDVTGDGTAYTIIAGTEIYDIGGDYNAATGVFTSPVTSKGYEFSMGVFLSDISDGVTHTLMSADFVTSNRTYELDLNNPDNIQSGTNMIRRWTIGGVDMDLGDTAFFRIVVSGATKIVDVLGGASNHSSFFIGHLQF